MKLLLFFVTLFLCIQSGCLQIVSSITGVSVISNVHTSSPVFSLKYSNPSKKIIEGNLEFAIFENKSLKIIQNSLSYNSMQRFLVPLNGDLTVDLYTEKGTLDEKTCYGLWAISNSSVGKQCASDLCDLNTFLSTNLPCTGTTKWKINSIGDFDINVNLMQKELKLTISVFINVVNRLIQEDFPQFAYHGFDVNLKPNPLPDPCEIIYDVKTKVEFYLKADDKIVDASFSIGTQLMEIKNKDNPFVYSFENQGSYEIEISITTNIKETFVWKRTFSIIQAVYNVSVNDILGVQFLKSDSRVTFSLVSANKCLPIPEKLTWFLNNQMFVASLNRIEYIPEMVGNAYKLLRLEIKELPLFSYEVSIFDPITNFNVEVDKYSVCVAENITVKFKIDYGTDVLFTYKVLPNIEINEVKSNSLLLSFENVSLVNVEFNATNPVSSSSIYKTIKVVSNFVVFYLPDFYPISTGRFHTLVKNISSCYQVIYYQWSIQIASNILNQTSWLVFDFNAGAHFNFTFNNEGYYKVVFTVMYGSNNSSSTSDSRFINVFNKIKYSMPEEINVNVNNETVIRPIDWQGSKIFYFRWWENGKKSDWEVENNGQPPFKVIAFKLEGKNNITLEVKNNVSQISCSSIVIAQYSAKFTSVELLQSVVEINTSFYITLHFSNISIFPYIVAIKTSLAEETFNITSQKRFIYEGKSSIEDVFLVNITISDNLNTFIRQATFNVIRKIQIVNVTVSQYNVIIGEMLFLEVFVDSVIQSVEWLYNTSIFNHTNKASITFSSLGIHIIKVIVYNQLSNDSKVLNVSVYPNINKLEVNAPILMATELQYFANSSISLSSLSYSWAVNGTQKGNSWNQNVSFSEPGFYVIELNVSSPIQFKNAFKLVEVIKLSKNTTIVTYLQLPLSIKRLFVAYNSSINLVIQNVNRIAYYSWEITPQDGAQVELLDHNARINFDCTSVDKSYDIVLEVKIFSGDILYNAEKYTYPVTVRKPIQNMITNLPENLVANNTYIFNISWEGSQSFIKKSLQVQGMKELKVFHISNNSINASLTTAIENQIINMTFEVCNELNCIEASDYGFQFNSLAVISSVEPFPSQKYVSSSSSLKLEVHNKMPMSTYEWYIGENFIGNTSTVEIKSLQNYAPGNYTVVVIVSGPFIINGKIKEIFVITIYLENCKLPKVQQYTKRRQHTRSLWFYSEINITSECNITYQWVFEEAKPNTDCSQSITRILYVPNGISGSVIKTNAAALQLPPRAFLIGYYCVINRIQFGENGSLDISFFLEVKGSTLLPKLSGGSFRVIGNVHDFVISASNSIDPDISYPNKPRLLYKWSYIECDEESETFKIDLSKWNKNTSVVHIKPFCLNPYQHYIFKVEVKREEFENEQPVFALQQLYVINGTVPIANIDCVTCNTYKSLKYVKYKQLKFFAYCTNCGSIEAIYNWQIVGINDNKLVTLDNYTLLTPLDAPVLILKSGVLDGLQSYKVVVNISVKGMDEAGSSSFLIENNLSPENGSCIVTPDIGMSFLTVFALNCSNWKDEDNLNQPFIYEVIANIGTISTTIYRGINPVQPILFPSGDERDNWMVSLLVQVEDSLGSLTKAFSGFIQVQPPNVSDYIQFLSNDFIPKLEKLVLSQDVNKASSAIIASVLLLENEKNETKVAEVLNKLVFGVASLNASSMETLYQISFSLDLAIGAGDKVGLNTDVRSLATSSLISLLNLADSFSLEGYSLPEESYMPILRIITSNTKADFEKAAVRKRRSTDLTLNYNLLNQLYKIILQTTLPGENEKKLESNSISTNLRRNKGSRLNGDVHAGKCSASSNFSQIANESDISQILECSTFNPFIYEEGSVSMLTFSYKNATLDKIPVSSLTDQECITLNVPAELDTSFTNSTLNFLPKEVYVSTLPSFENVAYFNEGAVNVLINIIEYSGKGLVYIYLSENVSLTADNKNTRVLAFGADDDAKKRILFLSGRNFSLSSVYYLGIEHDFANNITLNVFVYTSHCLYWNTLMLGWDSSGCIPTKESTHENIVCKCNHLTSFTGSFHLKPNPLNFSILEKLDIGSNPVAFATCVVVVLLYMIGLFIAYRRDRYEQKGEHIIPFIGGNDGFYQYEVRFKTGPYPFAGSSAKVGIQIFGTSCTTKVRVIKSNNSFQRNGLDIFRISVDKSIGKIHKIHVWHDNSGSSPSWYLERVVIRNLSNGEKFFFFCNRWLGIDFKDGSLEADFHVANTMEMQKFSTIFCDVLLRMFSDFHLWISVFERPKFSRFSRVQRITCLVTLILSWMAVNAMWFQVAPEGKIDLYIGFQSYSLEELAIAFITVAMVFPINLFFVLLFKKSRQRNIPQKQLKVWHQQRRTLMDVVEIDAKPFFSSSKGLEEFDINVVDSLVRRKKKVLNVHALVEQENNCSFLDSGRVKEKQFSYNATILHESSEISSDTENILLLPHSFNSGDNSFHRGSVNKSDTFHTNHNKDSIEKYHNLFRTQSLYSIKKNLVAADLQESLIKLRFSESQLNNRTERIVNFATKTLKSIQQISSMFDDLNEENHDDIKSEHSSGIFYQEPVSNILIKKNEILAEKLNIAEIHEYDPCTRWTLPHFFVYVGYVCCFSISLLSILITIIYGQYFGYELALKWLKMLIFGILGDFFLIFPFMLILLSALIAIIKPLDLDQIDHYDFVECGEFPESNVDTTMVSPLTGYSLEMAKQLGVKNKKIRKFAKFFVSQAILMWSVMSICWLIFPSSSSYTATKYFQKAWNSPTSMRSVHNMNDYWFWFEHSWVPFLYTQPNVTWMIASHPLIQINGYSNRGCHNEKYAIFENMTTCFVVSDQALNLCKRENNSSCMQVSHEFKMNFANKSSLIKVVKALKSLESFDGHKSSVKLEVIFANTRSSEHVYISHFFSIASGGFYEITSDIIFYRTDFFENTSDYFLVFCVVVLFIILLVNFSKFLSQGYRKGWRALKSFWNFHTALMLLFINVAIILIITHIVCIYQYRNKMNNGMVPSGSNNSTFAFLNNLVIYVLGFVGFLVIVRNVRLFRLSSGYLYCALTLSFAFKELVYFSLLHVLVSLMFAGAAVLLFDCWQIAGFSRAFINVLFMRWWKPGYKVIADSSYGFGNAWFLLWKFYWFVVVLNIFKAILNCSSQVKRAEVEKTKLGLLKHIWKKINGSIVVSFNFIRILLSYSNHGMRF